MNWYNLIKISQSNDIRLTEEEDRIFALIKSARNKYAIGIQLRVAGGWIRDRLLGKVSDDIDIAVSGGDGNLVAEAIRKFDLEMTGGKRTNVPYSVSLEKTLPGEKSKSSGLRVGAIEIFDVKIEFVPMRTETYDEKSRIPKIISTDDPREDVKRRDLTINAIYYNIDTGKIEDYCGGVEDLESKTLRTPVDPIITLKEDPLRALRALRFLSKMNGFKLDEQLKDALHNKEVHESYLAKVAPERAKNEIEKLAAGNNPGLAIRHLLESGLYIPVFNSSRLNAFNPITMDQNNPHHLHNLLDHTVSVIDNLDKILKEKGVTGKQRSLSILSALFHDFGKMDPTIVRPSRSNPNASSYPGHENVSAEVAEEILKRLGFGADREIVRKIVEQHMIPHGDIGSPKSIGKFIRELESITADEEIKSNLHKLIYYHAIADTLSKGKTGKNEMDDIDEKNKVLSQIDQYLRQRAEIGSKPLLDGKEIMKLFPEKNPKTGFIAQMQKALIEVQDTGQVTDIDSARKFLLERFK